MTKTSGEPHIIATQITESEPGIFHVAGTWGGVAVDRTESNGYAVRGRRLAERLAKAMLDGKVFTDPAVRVDVNGRTYVSANSAVLGRTANADLRRLGY